MSAADHLGAYAEGWTKGDSDLILSSLSDDYTLDDPNGGTIQKSEFADYLAGMKEAVSSLSGGNLPDPFMELTEVITHDEEGLLTAWCWWAIPGTEIKGSGLIKVDSSGVKSEVLTYYTKLPE
jgi:hypothetical protein